jgi:hypothetical protein
MILTKYNISSQSPFCSFGNNLLCARHPYKGSIDVTEKKASFGRSVIVDRAVSYHSEREAKFRQNKTTAEAASRVRTH